MTQIAHRFAEADLDDATNLVSAECLVVATHWRASTGGAGMKGVTT